MVEHTVSASELARNTSALLDEVAHGNPVVIERRGQVVARLVPEPKSGASILGSMQGRATQLVDDCALMAPIAEWDAV